MSTENINHHFYGLQLADDVDQAALDEDPGWCLNNGQVGYYTVTVDKTIQLFLALWWKRPRPGEIIHHSGVTAVAPKFLRDRWNSDLEAVVDRLGLATLTEPGWITVQGGTRQDHIPGSNMDPADTIRKRLVGWIGGLGLPEDRDVLESHAECYLDDLAHALAGHQRAVNDDFKNRWGRDMSAPSVINLIDPEAEQ
jgi:hypothetical protein